MCWSTCDNDLAKITSHLHFNNYLLKNIETSVQTHRHYTFQRLKLSCTDTEEICLQQIGRILKESILSWHKYSTWRHNKIFPLSNKRSSSYFLMSTGAKLDMFIQSGPIKLNSLYYLKWLQDQIFKLRCHEIVKHFLPIHWSSLVLQCNTHNSQVVNFGVETT